MEKILAIDPGVTTGFAITTGTNLPIEPAWQRNFFELSDRPYWAFHRTLYTVDPDVIVCESFDFRQAKTGLDVTPAELIGVVKYRAETSNLKLVFQNPSVKSKKGFWDDKKLKHLGLYVPNLPHGMDALRHLLHYENSINKFDLNRLKDV